jgi:hypothetical protein
MDDDDNAAEQRTVAADGIGARTVAPPSTDAEADLAWSLDDDDETVSVERQSWGLAWAQAAVFVSIGAVFALAIGAVGWALTRAHGDSPRATPVAQRAAEVTQTTHPEAPTAAVASSTVTVEATPRTATVTATPPTVTVKTTPSTETVTVKATPPTVTVEPAPTTVTVPAPIPTVPSRRRSSAAAPREVDTLYDQRFLNQMRSLGYVIVNPQLALRNAHEACGLFRQGESAEQVNQQMSAQMGANMTDTLQLTSSAMLAYPDCY